MLYFSFRKTVERSAFRVVSVVKLLSRQPSINTFKSGKLVNFPSKRLKKVTLRCLGKRRTAEFVLDVKSTVM